MSVLIAQIGFHAVGSVLIAHAIGILEIAIIAAFYTLSFCVLGVLLGIWATLGDKPTPWRFVCIVAVSVALVCLRRNFVKGSEQFVFPILFLMVATSLAMFAARVAGVRLERVSRRYLSNLAFGLVRVEQDLEKIDKAAEPPKLQFSLWSIMSWTTAFAVLLSSLSVLQLYAVVPFRTGSWPGDLPTIALGIALVAPIVLVVIWIAFAAGWLVARVVVLCLAILAITLIAMPPSPFPFSASLMIVCIMAAVLIGSLRVFRYLTGYCLVWRKPAVWRLFRGTRRRI